MKQSPPRAEGYTTAVAERARTTRSGDRPVAAIILAAGKGERMASDLPKVAHGVADRPMVAWVVDACRAVGAQPIVLVVGYRQEVIREIFAADDDVIFAVQREQKGTADAVASARQALADFDGDVFILCGDGPLIRAETLRTILARHREAGARATLATSTIENPKGYGRIVRNPAGSFQEIVEEKNATPRQRAIREINPSYYCFDSRALFDALAEVVANPVSGEYYVTDVPAILKAKGHHVEVIDAVPPEDVLSINTPEQLREVEAILTARLEACR